MKFSMELYKMHSMKCDVYGNAGGQIYIWSQNDLLFSSLEIWMTNRFEMLPNLAAFTKYE